MQLSIVTTLYNSADHLMEFCQRMKATVEKNTLDYEIILVDDGSPDTSLEVAQSIQKKFDKFVIIELSRNFGHHRAAMTGLSYAKGDYVLLIDCDLEEAPEHLETFWLEMLQDSKIDVVYGVQKNRKGKTFERWSGSVFFRLLNFLSDIKISENACVIRLMKKRYVKNLLRYKEREMALGGILKLTGFNQKSIPIDKKSKGHTTYNLKRKISVAVNFITSMTSRPLVYVFYLGLIVSLFSWLWVFYLLIKKIVFGVSVSGWASIIASIWFLGGITIFCLGIIGMYLSKIFVEVKKRPYTIVKAVHSKHHNMELIEQMEYE